MNSYIHKINSYANGTSQFHMNVHIHIESAQKAKDLIKIARN